LCYNQRQADAHPARKSGGQMQFNVTTAERLELAQRDPEHYGNIAVRVSGYSSNFCLLTKELQDHIIARTKHRK
jgi:formate C-acetyltransferase